MLSSQFKSKVGSVASSSITLDNTSKELFTVAHNEFLKVSSENLKRLRKDINKYIDETFKSNEIKASIKRVVTVAYKYSELKAITYVDKLAYHNVKGVVTLLTYISKEYKEQPDVYKKVRKVLSRVSKGDTNVEYNNNMGTKLKELHNEYKVVATEEGELVRVSPTKLIHTVQNNIDNFNQQQVLELLELVQSKVKVGA